MGEPKIPPEKLPPELLKAFKTFRARHAPYVDPDSAKCGKLNTSWWLTGQAFEGKFVAECRVCNYRMLANPTTNELEHFDNPVEAMRNVLAWKLRIEDLLQGTTGNWRKHIDEAAQRRAEESLPEAGIVADLPEPGPVADNPNPGQDDDPEMT